MKAANPFETSIKKDYYIDIKRFNQYYKNLIVEIQRSQEDVKIFYKEITGERDFINNLLKGQNELSQEETEQRLTGVEEYIENVKEDCSRYEEAYKEDIQKIDNFQKTLSGAQTQMDSKTKKAYKNLDVCLTQINGILRTIKGIQQETQVYEAKYNKLLENSKQQ